MKTFIIALSLLMLSLPAVSKAEEPKYYEGFEAELIMFFGEVLNTIWDDSRVEGRGIWQSIVLLKELPQTSFATFNTGVYLCRFQPAVYECTQSMEGIRPDN